MRVLTGLFLGIFLTACSFSPLYLQTDDQIIAKTSQIQIEPIDGTIGYVVRDQLDSKLETHSADCKKYTLIVKVQEKVVGDLGIQKTNFATRSRLILTANYQLKELSSQKILLEGTTNASGSYNLTTAYSTMTAKDKMKQNLGKIVADNIAIRLLMYFKKQEVSGESAKVSN